MVSFNRIKEYIFPQTSANSTGSATTVYTSHSINGELVRLDSTANWVGSLILSQSGLTTSWTNLTTTSGTNKFESLSFSNTTGSFMTNNIIQIVASGLASGTNTVFGPISLLYR